MLDTLQLLKDNPYSWGIILLITITLALISVLQSIKRKQLRFFIQTKHVIDKNSLFLDKLTINYSNEQIDNLMVSNIALINVGNVIVDHSDIPLAAPLSIRVEEDCRILSVEVIDITNEAISIELSCSKSNFVSIVFDYFEKKDAVIFQVIHSGKSDIISLDGNIKGGIVFSPPCKLNPQKLRIKKSIALLGRKIRRTLVISLLVGFGLLSLYSLIMATKSTPSNLFTKPDDILLLYVSIGLSLFFGIMFGFACELEPISSVLPLRFAKYFDFTSTYK